MTDVCNHADSHQTNSNSGQVGARIPAMLSDHRPSATTGGLPEDEEPAQPKKVRKRKKTIVEADPKTVPQLMTHLKEKGLVLVPTALRSIVGTGDDDGFFLSGGRCFSGRFFSGH